METAPSTELQIDEAPTDEAQPELEVSESPTAEGLEVGEAQPEIEVDAPATDLEADEAQRELDADEPATAEEREADEPATDEADTDRTAVLLTVTTDDALATEPDAEESAEADAEAAPALAESGVKRRTFHSKRGSDALAPLALLAALACAGALGLQAFQGELTSDLGLSIGLTVAAAVLLVIAMRVANSSRVVHIDDRGTLKLTVGETHHEFDLTSPATKLEQAGTPDERGWRVLILRRSMSPVIIDARTVDPSSFIEALRQWRPDL